LSKYYWSITFSHVPHFPLIFLLLQTQWLKREKNSFGPKHKMLKLKEPNEELMENMWINDATILFDSFTHIYLVFCLCFIYIMPWYSLFYIFNVLLDVRFKKKSKLEIIQTMFQPMSNIDRFDLRSIFCAEPEI